MSQDRPKWKEYERYFLRHGFSVYSKGGDKIIVAPPDQSARRTRQVVVVGHRFARPGQELPHGHVRQIERAFGVSPEDVRGG